MKQVREASDCAAKIILNKKGEHVATVQWRYGSGGGVQCDVWSRKTGENWESLTHQKKFGGYGYDKAAAALSGAIIEGYRMADHCGYVEEAGEKKRAALLKAYKRRANSGLPMSREDHAAFEKKAARIGCRFANWGAVCLADGGNSNAWQSLHNEQGLVRLEMLGYRVITAL
jgi:hypothetical protein